MACRRSSGTDSFLTPEGFAALSHFARSAELPRRRASAGPERPADALHRSVQPRCSAAVRDSQNVPDLQLHARQGPDRLCSAEPHQRARCGRLLRLHPDDQRLRQRRRRLQQAQEQVPGDLRASRQAVHQGVRLRLRRRLHLRDRIQRVLATNSISTCPTSTSSVISPTPATRSITWWSTGSSICRGDSVAPD